MKENLLIAVTDQQGSFSGIPVESDMIGDEAVAKAVFRRTFGFPFHTGLATFFTLSIFIGNIVGFNQKPCAFESFATTVHKLTMTELEG